MSLFADLFSCGRTRKPRETPAEPHGANDTIGATPKAVSPKTTTANDLLTADNRHHVRPSNNGESYRARENARGEVATDAKEQDNAVSEDQNATLAVIEEKAKQSGGWMVERRVLVTATPPHTADAAPVVGSECEPETCDDIPRVPCVTSELERSESTPTTHATTEPELCEDTSVAPTTTGRAPDEANTLISVEKPEPVLETTFAEEVAPSALDPENATDNAPIPKARATVQLLDLPPEIRKHIYSNMNEEAPIRMCRHDDPALAGEHEHYPRRQFYNLTQVCHQIRDEFLPTYASNTEYIIDLWAQKANLARVDAMKGQVSMDIDAACFDMEPIDLLLLIRCLARTRRTDVRFASTEGVVFQSIQAIVDELNKLLPSQDGSNKAWLNAVNGPMKRLDLHLFPHEDVRQYYRFRGAEPLLRIVYPAAVSEEWMKRASKSDGYEEYLTETGLDTFDMHVVVGHASRRTTNEGRLPLDWRMSLQLSRLSIDGTRTPRMSMDVVAARMSMDKSPRIS